MNELPHAVQLLSNTLRIIDQTALPDVERWLTLGSSTEVIEAIQRLAVRGAPAIGVAGAGAAWLAAMECRDSTFAEDFELRCRTIANARPTAVNLRYAVDRVRASVAGAASPNEARALARKTAEDLIRQEALASESMGRIGGALIEANEQLLTYCNTGWLATTGDGTALSVIYSAHRAGKNISVYSCESRPLLQGARLTAWELTRAGIPVTVICDNTVGIAMAMGRVNRVLVGADRIAANGDTANKIGTYMVAVLAKRHGVPFHVVAPTTTFDLTTPDGTAIPIEERDESEVLCMAGRRVAAAGARAFAPAFDVTPASLITSIVTERGVIEDISERGVRAHLA